MSGADEPIEPSSGKSKTAESEPVWHKPAWITAIVGLVSAFLTVPEVVSDYLSKQQEIDAARIEVEKSRQSKEFEVIQNSLSQQGEERIFMLRYFAATLDDPEAKDWAANEVDRFDKLVAERKKVEEQRIALAAKEAEIARLTEESAEKAELETQLAELRAELNRTNLTYQSLRSEAGIAQQAPVGKTATPGTQIVIDAVLPDPETGSLDARDRPFYLTWSLTGADGTRMGECGPMSCVVSMSGFAPETVEIETDPTAVIRIEGTTVEYPGGPPRIVTYGCAGSATSSLTVCTRLPTRGGSARATAKAAGRQ